MRLRLLLPAAFMVVGWLSAIGADVEAQTVAVDPLPSWNEGPAKAAILDFVARTTRRGSPDFVAQVDRIAVFDNDGTLWPENPVPFEIAFALDAAKARAAKDLKLKDDPAYKAAEAGDVAALTAN